MNEATGQDKSHLTLSKVLKVKKKYVDGLTIYIYLLLYMNVYVQTNSFLVYVSDDVLSYFTGLDDYYTGYNSIRLASNSKQPWLTMIEFNINIKINARVIRNALITNLPPLIHISSDVKGTLTFQHRQQNTWVRIIPPGSYITN